MKTRTKRQNKHGISLIVLVITIIVMIILAATIMISLSNNGIIGKANEAVIANDIANLKTQVEMLKGDKLITAIQAGRNLTQQELIDAIQAYYPGSTVSGNIITVENGKYDIVVQENSNVAVVEHGKYTGPIKDIEVAYTTTKVNSETYAHLDIKLLSVPSVRALNAETESLFIENEFLNWLDWEGLLEKGGAILYPGANLDAATVYTGQLADILGVDYETFKNDENRNEIVKANTPYATIESLGKNMIADGFKSVNTFMDLGRAILYAKDMLPELSNKTAEEMSLIITSWYNNEKTIDEITKKVAINQGIEVNSFEEWYAGISMTFGMEDPSAYIFSREQAMLMIASGAYTETHPVVIKYPNGTTKEIDWYMLTSMQDTSYALTSSNKGITVVSPVGYESYTAQSTAQNNWVTAIVDGVPIPKGFVASPYEGEKTKDGGLVIYELAANENAIPASETEHTSKTTRNQYVWVPVEDFSKFIRQNFGQPDDISDIIGNNYWEITDKTIGNISYMTVESLKEVQAMYDSVKTYKGFYIARYEAGLDVGSQKTSDDGEIIKSVHSKMNKAPYNYVRWTYNDKMSEDTNGAVEVARSIYPATNAKYGVVSTLTYGVQWDRTLAWWKETKATNGTGDVTIDSNTKLNDSTNYGNYYNNEIPNATFNAGAYVSKDSGTTYKAIDSSYSKTNTQSHILTTGATEETRVNNIYDMAGNLWEWTMEGSDSTYRVLRGGNSYYYGVVTPVSYRFNRLQS